MSTTSNVSTAISQAIAKALSKLSLEVEINLEHPADESHGDYATNAAMIAYGVAKKENKQISAVNSRELAQELVALLKSDHNLDDFVQVVEVAGPGFINFTLKPQVFLDQLLVIIKQPHTYGSSQNLTGQKIIIEYTDPNPFKEFHIGHVYSNSVGESISRLLEFQGAEVNRADYFGDVGMHVAKSIWGWQQQMNRDNLTVDQMIDWPLNKRVKYLGQAYAKGATAYEEDDQAKDKIKDLNYMVYVAGQEFLKRTKGWQPLVDYRKFFKADPQELENVIDLYLTGRQWTMDHFEVIFHRLGTQFDRYYPESEAGEYGFQLVNQQYEAGVFEKSDGAIIFKGDQHGLHTQVFINSLGLPTYAGKDIGLPSTKYKDFKYDQSIIVTANEIDEYFKVVLTALSQFQPELASKTTHFSHGMVKLPEGKMSSRTGKIVAGEWLLDETQAVVKQKMDQKLFDDQEMEIISDQIAIGAVKYAMLKNGIGGDIVFDFASATSLTGNSGPYLQYAHTRCLSIINKAGKVKNDTIDIKPNTEEQALLRWLSRFPEAVSKASSEFSPSYVATYLHELAQRYNTLYNQHPILSAESPDQVTFRLQLTQATAIVLKTGLHLLGIQAPERM